MTLSDLRQKLGQPVDAASLGLFRVLWGVLAAWEAVKRLQSVESIFSPDFFHLTYPLFPWVAPLPEVWMIAAEAWLMIACGLAIALGVGFRAATALYTLCYAHFFLSEALYYNNHFYLAILMNGLMFFSRADAEYSLRRWREKRRGAAPDPPTVPLWNLVLLRGQIFVLYFWGAIAKLNGDWIAGEPIRLWLRHLDLVWPLSALGQQEWFVYFMSLSGIAIDLSAGFLLLHRRTFWPMSAVLVAFHLTNHLIFPIGLFPFIGIALLAVFLEPSWPRRAAAWVRGVRAGRSLLARMAPAAPVAVSGAAVTPIVAALVVGYLAFQALWPLRILAYGQNPSWTDVGQRFSWRMMLRYKDAYLSLDFDPPDAEWALEDAGLMPRMPRVHRTKLEKSHETILQYVHELDRRLETLGMPDVAIHVVSIAALNGRPYQLMIDPGRDLTRVSGGFFTVPDWVVPLKPNLRVGQYPEDKKQRNQMLRRAMLDWNRENPDGRQLRIVD